MSKEGTARKPVDPEPFGSTKASSDCAQTFRLLQVAMEVHRGAVSLEKQEVAGEHAFMFVFFTLGEKTPPTRGLIMDGVLYLSALDASALVGRERERLRAVARRTANA